MSEMSFSRRATSVRRTAAVAGSRISRASRRFRAASRSRIRRQSIGSVESATVRLANGAIISITSGDGRGISGPPPVDGSQNGPVGHCGAATSIFFAEPSEPPGGRSTGRLVGNPHLGAVRLEVEVMDEARAQVVLHGLVLLAHEALRVVTDERLELRLLGCRHAGRLLVGLALLPLALPPEEGAEFLEQSVGRAGTTSVPDRPCPGPDEPTDG